MPETSGEGASRNEVGCGFHAQVADFASVIVQAMFLHQIFLYLDAILDQKPTEEFDLWRGTILPNKLVEVAASPCRDNRPI